jgi:hypothetical protein
VQVAITYQVVGSDGQDFQQAGLVPYEEISNRAVTVNGSTTNPTGATHSLGAPTNALGQFVDTPFGGCATPGNTVTSTGTQTIFFMFDGVRINVQTNTYEFKVTGPHQGSVKVWKKGSTTPFVDTTKPKR